MPSSENVTLGTAACSGDALRFALDPGFFSTALQRVRRVARVREMAKQLYHNTLKPAWTPKVCKVISFLQVLGHYFAYFGGVQVEPRSPETLSPTPLAPSTREALKTTGCGAGSKAQETLQSSNITICKCIYIYIHIYIYIFIIIIIIVIYIYTHT